MDERSLQDIVRQLSDLDLALFLCLAAREHCLIETTGDDISDLTKELALVNPHDGVLIMTYVFTNAMTDLREHV